MATMSTDFSKTKARRGHLRHDIVGASFTITFSLLVIFAAFTYVWQRTSLESDAVERVAAIATVQEARVDAYIDLGLAGLEMTRSRSQLVELLAAFDAAEADVRVEEIEALLQETVGSNSQVASVTVYGSTLQQVASTETPGHEYGLPDGFLESSAERINLGTVVQGADGGFAHLIAGPIDLDGSTIGVAVVATSMQPLFDLATDFTGLGESGETLLGADSGGRAVFIAPLRFDSAGPLAVVGPESRDLPMNEALDGVERVVTDSVDYRGEQTIAATRQVERAGWGIVVKIDRSEAIDPAWGFARFALLLLVGGSVLAGFMAWNVARAISDPIKELTAAAKAIAAGDRTRQVPVDRTDDIGELASAFNVMTRELRALAANLEDRVTERSVEIEAKTSELEKRNAEMTRLMEERETFLAGVSHEVRSPLTAMIGFLDLINETGDALGREEREEMLATVAQQADDILNLIEDLLAVARVDAGTLRVVSVRVDLGAQARQVIEAFTFGARTSVKFLGDETIARADPARVRQIVRNLLTNAARYGGPEVEVEVTNNGSSVALEVRDNGEGIPEKDLDRVFTAYGQGSSSRAVDDSVGLGLHVASQLAELMDGELVYRRESGWSVFTLALPVFVAESLPAASFVG